MASSVIETQRVEEAHYSHLAASLVQLLVDTPKPAVSTHRERLLHAHLASHKLDKLVSSSQALAELYADPRGVRKDEIELLAGSGVRGNEVTEFYNRLAKLKDWHRRYPDQAAEKEDVDDDLAELEGATGGAIDGRDFLDRLFAGEESVGRYYDLNNLHTLYTNLPNASRISYLAFLDVFDDFDRIAKPRKLHGDKYKEYLTALLDYLRDFARRAFPMQDLSVSEEKAAQAFELEWAKGHITAWQTEKEEGIWCPACA